MARHDRLSGGTGLQSRAQPSRVLGAGQPDVARGFFRARLVAATALVLSAMALAIIWSWEAGWIVAALASIALVDTAKRLRFGPADTILVPLLVDITVTGAAMVLAGLPDIVVIAPFVHHLVAAVLVLSRRTGLLVSAYLGLWSVGILTLDAVAAPSLDPGQQEVVASISVGVYLVATFIMTSAAASAVRDRYVLDERLRTNAAQLQTVVDGTEIVLFAIDVDGFFTLSEGPGLRLLGLEPGQVVGMHISEVYGEMPDVLALVEAGLTSDEDTIGELAVGSLSFSVQLRPQQDATGRKLGVVGVGIDVTEQARYRRDLEALIRSKDEFVASVSHELRTPLSVVYGLGEELNAHASDFDADETQELHSLLAQQAGEVTAIVEDLLVVARADIDRLIVLNEHVDLGTEIRSSIRPLNVDERVTVIDSAEPVRAWCDRGRLRQIVRNLVTNGLRHGGPHIEVSYRSGADQVMVEVRDDGAGVPAEDQARIFEAYENARAHPGTPASIGLGLTVARKLARLMNGDIEYQRRDNWSVFVVTLPPAEAPVNRPTG